ncbi:hypothetical protein [Lysinibacillus sp. 3P01SB]|uniref:hypothetical protein n=1 Tax=Lysinibacillus sp. 3P01SB TaxID=3132284 RepID=UPI0039A505E4
MILYLTIYSHFSILILVLMALSGLISFLFPRLSTLFMVVILGVIGYMYAFFINSVAVAPSIISIILITSLIPIFLVKYTLHLQRKAEQLSNLQNT